MICKTSISNLFRGIPITDDFVLSILGKPVVDNGIQIGIITGACPDTDELYMRIDGVYKEQFEKVHCFEIIYK